MYATFFLVSMMKDKNIHIYKYSTNLPTTGWYSPISSTLAISGDTYGRTDMCVLMIIIVGPNCLWVICMFGQLLRLCVISACVPVFFSYSFLIRLYFCEEKVIWSVSAQLGFVLQLWDKIINSGFAGKQVFCLFRMFLINQ